MTSLLARVVLSAAVVVVAGVALGVVWGVRT